MQSKLIQIGMNNFNEEVLQSTKPAMVYFYSEDCAPCIALDPIVERIAKTYEGKMQFFKIFRQHNRVLAEKLQIKSSPTLLFFDKGEEVCSRLNGYISKPQLRLSIENVLGGTCPIKPRSKVYCDVLILGGGPAGLSAAIYSARAKLFTVIVDESIPGGQVATTYHIANYPGTNGVIRGIDLIDNMKKQALDFGAQIDDLKEIIEVDFSKELKFVKGEDTDYFAKTVIIATGAQPRKLPAKGESEFRGRGVHYCATCDGALYQDADVLVIGGGNSAVEEAIFLTRYVKKVTIIHQYDHLQASKSAQEEAFKNPAIEIIWDSEVREIKGEVFVTHAVIENLKTKELKEVKTDGLFVYIGMEPRTELFSGKIILNNGYIPTDNDMMTNIQGVFAAGDVRDKKIRQIATATGDGVTAGIMAERFVNYRL